MAEPLRKRRRLSATYEPAACLIEARLSEEILVHCLGSLAVDDLVRCARLSSYWHRLANEPSLWRAMFMHKFAPKQKRRAALPEQTSRSWKDLYKIQQRWLDGRARSTAIDLRSSVLEPPPLDLALPSEAEKPAPNTIVRFRGQHVFVASRSQAAKGCFPAVQVHLNSPIGPQAIAQLRPSSLSTKESLSVTEIALDEVKGGRLAVFYSNGQFAIFDHPADGDFIEIFAGSKRGVATALARLHSPLLVTCSSDFAVTFTSIAEAKPPSNRLTLRRLAAPMRTPICWSPLVLTLRSFGGHKFRVNVAHSAPHFPGSWTVALHEFDVSLDAADDGERIIARQVTASPTSSALVTALEYRPPWLVASRADNTLDVYLARTSPPDGSPTQLSLEHWRTLWGHTAAVHTVSLGKGGRCVSGGSDGRVKVWALSDTAATAVTVLSEPAEKPLPPPPTVSWLGFDDEKIVILRSPTRGGRSPAEMEDVQVLSFD